MEKSLLLLLPILSVATCALVDYSDLQALGVACSPSDTCSNTTGRTFFKSSCECDRWCHAFDDCCVDAPRNPRHNGVEKRLGITCLQVELFRGVYVIEKCTASWNGSNVVRRKCEDEDDLSDPFMSIPTTDIRTNVTYRNRYCAECNYGSLDRMSSWSITITCSSLDALDKLYNNITEDFILQNITRSGTSWGVYHWNVSLGYNAFYPCEVTFQLPHSLHQHIRYCRTQRTSTCPDGYCRTQPTSTCADDWNREVVRDYCLSYMAVIHINNQTYRNAHCALCNHVSVRNRICGYPEFTTKRARPSLSFTLLMDVNPSDGGNVAESNPCSSGEKYDPFAKMCRPLVCALPGHVFRGGRCVPE